MPVLAVQHCRNDFELGIQDALAFVRQVRTFQVPRPGGRPRPIGVRLVELLAGLALLRTHLAWEEFVEDVFLRYMCGARSAAGYAPVLLAAREPRISDAMKRLLGPKWHYLDWNPQNILTWAQQYFDHGEPFATALGTISQTLDEIIVIRNRIAHRSDFSAQRFRAVVLKWFGYMPRGMTAGRFLLAVNPSPAAGGQTFIEHYANSLLGAGPSIVP